MLNKKYNFEEVEEKWLHKWEDESIYHFDYQSNKPIFSIDTPPPTVSGKIHIGHVFSYTQAEALARYKRIRGYNVFYPFGFDDNGLPTERLVEKVKKVRGQDLTRSEFKHLIEETVPLYEENFQKLFQRLGFSVDWNLLYKTSSKEVTKISQRAFLELIEEGKCYEKESPSLWCTECGTSIAQAELETKTVDSFFNYLKFKTTDGDDFLIGTTRPELLPAIVAIFINPDDNKNKHLIGKKAIVPLINKEVLIRGDNKVDPTKGTGIVMCCTFGDQTDIYWWQKYNLDLCSIITEYGKIKQDVPNYGGLKLSVARQTIIEDLKKANLLDHQEAITHEVMTHERCGKPIDYLLRKQFFIDITKEKEKFLELGKEIKWYPHSMFNRYLDWVNNVSWDWCISRQRYFGVPFPVWYCKKCGKAYYADLKDLPVDPVLEKCPYNKCECGGEEFIPNNDVMDTWATSSLTPLINMKYKEKENLEKKIYPMSLRANASDIIRTWDFYTIVRSYYHLHNIPWKNVMISGFVMASKGEKISKSKGNTNIEPEELIKTYSSDVVRYWASSGSLGTDIAYNEETFKNGRKLVNKIWNVAKFIELHLDDYKNNDFTNFTYFDKYYLNAFKIAEERIINYLDHFEIGLALNTLEKFFWDFCDNYVEIVKHRLYRPEEFGKDDRLSGQTTFFLIFSRMISYFSIYLPFVTEEIYQELFKKYFVASSIHILEIQPYKYNYAVKYGEELLNIIKEVRGEKSKEALSLKTEVILLKLNFPKGALEEIKEAIPDIKATLNINELKLNESQEFKIEEIKLAKESENN